jgi:predicted nucleic acid-binding protein
MVGDLIGTKPMNDRRVFLDSNVVIYAYSQDNSTKRDRARLLIADNYCFVSTLVINEFCNVSTKKLKLPLSIIYQYITDILVKCEYVPVDLPAIRDALSLHDRYQFSYFDCLMIASALKSECAYLFSEDLQDGQVIDGLTVRNIFRN